MVGRRALRQSDRGLPTSCQATDEQVSLPIHRRRTQRHDATPDWVLHRQWTGYQGGCHEGGSRSRPNHLGNAVRLEEGRWAAPRSKPGRAVVVTAKSSVEDLHDVLVYFNRS